MEAKNWYKLAKENAPSPPPPKMTERVKNFAGSLIKYMATGMNRVSDDIQRHEWIFVSLVSFITKLKAPIALNVAVF